MDGRYRVVVTDGRDGVVADGQFDSDGVNAESLLCFCFLIS